MKYSIWIISAGILLFSCKSREPEPENTEGEAALPAQYEIQQNDDFSYTSLTAQVSSDFIRCRGNVVVPPNRIHSISSHFGGFITKLEVIPGAKVNQGELLATLSHQDYVDLQESYLKSKHELAYLEKEYKRQQNLQEGKASALKTFEKTEAAYKSEKSKFNSLTQKLKLAGISPEDVSEGRISSTVNIYAPVSGYISDFDINLGDYLSPGSSLFDLFNYDKLHVDLQVFEKDIGKVQKDQKVSFKLAQSYHTTYEAKVSAIGQEVNKKTKTITVHCFIDGQYDFLRQGMQLSASIHTGHDSIYTLPPDAVIHDTEKAYVYVLEGNKLKRTELDIKSWENDYVVIGNREGLEGKDILLNPEQILK